MRRAAFLIVVLGALAQPVSAQARCQPMTAHPYVRLGPRARRAGAVSVSAPHALARTYMLRGA